MVGHQPSVVGTTRAAPRIVAGSRSPTRLGTPCSGEIGLDAGSGSRQPFEPACASFAHLRLAGLTTGVLSSGTAGNLSSATEVPEASEAIDHLFFPSGVTRPFSYATCPQHNALNPPVADCSIGFVQFLSSPDGETRQGRSTIMRKNIQCRCLPYRRCFHERERR